MAQVFADRVLETSTSTGTGAFALNGAVTGYQAFSAVCASADTVSYYIESVDDRGIPTGEWETGIGTWSANTLTRTTVQDSSNAGSAVSFGGGTKRVGLCYVAAQIMAKTDTRALAKWFAGGFDGRSVLWVGDSTTEQLAGISRVAYAGGYLSELASIEPALINRVSFKNRGANGNTLSGFVSAGSANNAGGYGYKLDDICTELATLTNPLVVLCYGINDVRSDATIAGQAYGSSAHQTAASAIRANLVTACNRMFAANANTSIILRMPNGFSPTAAGYLTNSVTGQNAMDVLRLAYRGDSTYSMSPIDEVIGGQVTLFDTFRLLYGDTSYASFGLVHTDGLHPSTIGYDRMFAAILRLIAGPEASSFVSSASAANAIRYERSVGHGPQRPRNINDVKNSGEWEQITTCVVVSAQPTYFDLGFGSTVVDADAAWGAAAGAGYGTAAQPQVGMGDVLILEPNGLDAIIIPFGRMADSRTGNYVRWYSGGPDGYYPTLAQAPVATPGTLWRHKHCGADNARRNTEALAAGNIRKAAAYRYAYKAFVTSGASGSIVLRGIGGQSSSLAAHTMTTSDTICLVGVDDSASGGVVLTGATFSGPDTTTGVLTITLAGRDFSKFAHRQAVILSNT